MAVQLKDIFPQGPKDNPQWASAAKIRTQMVSMDKMRIDTTTGGVGVNASETAAFVFDLLKGLDDPNAPLSEQDIENVIGQFSKNLYVYGVYRQLAWDHYERQTSVIKGGQKTLMVADGRRAISLLLSALPLNSHIIVTPGEVYSGTFKMFTQTMQRTRGLQVDFVDNPTEATLKAALKPNTKMLLSETYSNPRMSVADLSLGARFAQENGLLYAVDNTMAPLLVRPLDNGASYEVASGTKDVSGQNDVIAGSVTESSDPDNIVNRFDDLMELLEVEDADERSGYESAGLLGYLRNVEGGTMSVSVCNTLYSRLTNLPGHMEAVSSNGLEIAQWLTDQKGIDHVYYPGLESHPGHHVASQYARGFGGLVTFVTHGDRYDAAKFAVGLNAAGINYFDSWGGQMPNAVLVGEQTSRYKAMSDAQREAIGMPHGLNRFYVGRVEPDFCKYAILNGLRASFRSTVVQGTEFEDIVEEPVPVTSGVEERAPDGLS